MINERRERNKTGEIEREREKKRIIKEKGGKVGTKFWALEGTSKRYHGDRLNWRITNLFPCIKNGIYIQNNGKRIGTRLQNHLTGSNRQFLIIRNLESNLNNTGRPHRFFFVSLSGGKFLMGKQFYNMCFALFFSRCGAESQRMGRNSE